MIKLSYKVFVLFLKLIETEILISSSEHKLKFKGSKLFGLYTSYWTYEEIELSFIKSDLYIIRDSSLSIPYILFKISSHFPKLMTDLSLSSWSSIFETWRIKFSIE